MSKLALHSLSVENLRGYSATSLGVKPLTILVGENNQGKSSLLKMLEWTFQKPDAFWNSERLLTEEDLEFWSPANDAKHKARRFSLGVRFTDGRIARRFSCAKGDVLSLRLAIGINDQTCRLNLGSPKRSESHDSRASSLLALVRQHLRLVFLPPVRDGRSSNFADKVTRDVKVRLHTKLRHAKRAGAPKEYRLAHEVLSKLKKIVELNTRELARSNDSPLGAMLKASEVRLDLHMDDLASFIENALSIHLSTGTHDELKVLPNDVGNGLQSLLDINLSVEEARADSKLSSIFVIEEPEAFLHPAPQRQFMDFLRSALSTNLQSAILTTHSPFIIDEGRYGEIVIVRDQKHFEPTVHDAKRTNINTALMTTASSEMLFARTICFVEGEGDRAFFSTLMRRLRKLVPISPAVSGLVFQPTGSSTYFAPWMHLARSYSKGTESPFRIVWLMDGDAAIKGDSGARPVLGLASECHLTLSQQEIEAIVHFGDLPCSPTDRNAACSANANSSIRKHGGFLFCLDLEWAIFNGATPAALQSIKNAVAGCSLSTDGTTIDIARRLGSKIGAGSAVSRPSKAAYVRAAIADQIDLTCIPPEIYSALNHIFDACFATEHEKLQFLAAANVSSAAAS